MDVPSPCIRLCTLDDDDVCVGCGRRIEEITGWADAGAARKQQIVDLARQRLEQMRARYGNLWRQGQ